MPSANKSVKQQLRDYLAANQPAAITEAVWQDLLQRFAPVSESYLRDLLRDTGLPFDQPYSGIRQHTFEELEQSLLDMLQVYRDSLAGWRTRPGALLPPPGDRRQGSREIPGRHPAQHTGKTQPERRDGAVDAGVAGKSRSLPRVGGRAEKGDLESGLEYRACRSAPGRASRVLPVPRASDLQTRFVPAATSQSAALPGRSTRGRWDTHPSTASARLQASRRASLSYAAAYTQFSSSERSGERTCRSEGPAAMRCPPAVRVRAARDRRPPAPARNRPGPLARMTRPSPSPPARSEN